MRLNTDTGKQLLLRLRIASRGKTLRISDDGTKVFSKKVF